MGHVRTGGAAVVAFILFLALRVPAAALAPAVSAACGGRCVAVGFDGTLWRGSGTVRWRGGDGQEAAWSCAWEWQAGMGGVGWHLSGTGGGSAALYPGWSGWRLRAAGLALPAAALGDLIAGGTAPGAWGGALRVAAADGYCTTGGCTGRASIEWRGAEVAALSVVPLGDYSIELAKMDDDVSPKFEWHSGKGPLRIDGRGRLKADGIEFFGEAWVDTEAARAGLEPLLRTLGSADAAAGRYRLAWPSTPTNAGWSSSGRSLQ